MATQGTWTVGGYTIPDFGITEGTPLSYMNPDTFVNPNINNQTTSVNMPVATSYPGTQGFIGPALNPSSSFVSNSTGTQPTGQVQGVNTQTTTQQPQNTGGQSITEQDALRLGLDWNNLPGGYSRNIPTPGGPSDQELSAAYDPIFQYLNQA